MTTNTPEYKVVVTPIGNRVVKVTPINRVKKQTALDYENTFQHQRSLRNFLVRVNYLLNSLKTFRKVSSLLHGLKTRVNNVGH